MDRIWGKCISSFGTQFGGRHRFGSKSSGIKNQETCPVNAGAGMSPWDRAVTQILTQPTSCVRYVVPTTAARMRFSNSGHLVHDKPSVAESAVEIKINKTMDANVNVIFSAIRRKLSGKVTSNRGIVVGKLMRLRNWKRQLMPTRFQSCRKMLSNKRVFLKIRLNCFSKWKDAIAKILVENVAKRRTCNMIPGHEIPYHIDWLASLVKSLATEK